MGQKGNKTTLFSCKLPTKIYNIHINEKDNKSESNFQVHFIHRSIWTSYTSLKAQQLVYDECMALTSHQLLLLATSVHQG